ncbi:Uncharacterised protein [uncultured archaeon]|nr:Uncharacterised protein [uncultured archaeon]
MARISFVLIVAVAFCLFSQVVFADAGPGPDPATLPYVVLNVTYNGAPVPNETTVQVYCFVNGIENWVPTTSLSCENGICSNSGWYKLSPCVHSENATAVFEFAGIAALGNRSVNSSALKILGGKTYSYDVSISGSGAVSAVETGVTDNPASFCPISFALLAVALLGFAGLKRA